MSKKILVVDDSPEIRFLLNQRLVKLGFEVILAEDGEKGLEKALEEKPDIIFMDIMMPIMDGITATLKLKEDPKTKNIPIIMLTALSDTGSVIKSYDYGADYYINKPFAKEELIKALKFVENLMDGGL